MTDGRPDVSAFDADEQARRSYQQGRLDGFSEARDAVAALKPSNTIDPDALWVWEEALAAIDALRGEQ